MENTAVLEGYWEAAEVEASPEVPPRRRRFAPLWFLAGRIARGLVSAAEWLFGVVSLLVGLSTLAALPLLQFLTLGYLLESSARVARSGRLRDGFVGVHRAARIGGLAMGIWLATLPAWLVGSLARSADLIDPGSPAARGWRVPARDRRRADGLPRPHRLRPRRPAASFPLAVRPSLLAGPKVAPGRALCRIARPILGVPRRPAAPGTTSAWDSWGFSARSPG